MQYVVLTSKNGCNIVNKPLSIDSHELVAERIGLDVVDQLLGYACMIQTVCGLAICFIVLVDLYVPELRVCSKLREDAKHWWIKSTHCPNENWKSWISKWIVHITEHRREAKLEEEYAPSCDANNEVVLRREAHVIDRTPSVSKRTVESSSADPSCRSYPETVVTVGKVVINLVTMHDFQNMKQENIDDHLW